MGEDCGDGLLSILFWRSGTPLCGTVGGGGGDVCGEGVEGGSECVGREVEGRGCVIMEVYVEVVSSPDPPARRGSGDIWLIPWASLKIHSLLYA